MSTRTIRRVSAVAVAGSLALAGCSSSGGTKSADADTAFVKKIDTVCATAVAKHKGATLPVASFDPTAPASSELPAVGNYFATYGGMKTVVSAIDAAGSPSKHQAEWTQLRGLIDRAGVLAANQIAAAERSDVAAFVQTVHETKSLSAQINAAAKKVGFTSSSPCYQVFG